MFEEIFGNCKNEGNEVNGPTEEETKVDLDPNFGVLEEECDCEEDDECDCGGNCSGCGQHLEVGDVFLFTTTPNIALLSGGLFAPNHRILIWKMSETRYELLSGSGWFSPAKDDMSAMFSYLITKHGHLCNVEKVYNVSDHIDDIELNIFKKLCGVFVYKPIGD